MKKIVIGSTSAAIVLFIVLLAIFSGGSDSKIVDYSSATFSLTGDETVTHDVDTEYEDSGYTITYNDNTYTDVSELDGLSVSNNSEQLTLDNIGTYELAYTFSYEGTELTTLSRTIEVIYVENIEITINDAKYTEDFTVAYYIGTEVSISGDISNKKDGYTYSQSDNRTDLNAEEIGTYVVTFYLLRDDVQIDSIEVTIHVVEVELSIYGENYTDGDSVYMYTNDVLEDAYVINPFDDYITAQFNLFPSTTFDITKAGVYDVEFTLTYLDQAIGSSSFTITVLELVVIRDGATYTGDTEATYPIDTEISIDYSVKPLLDNTLLDDTVYTVTQTGDTLDNSSVGVYVITYTITDEDGNTLHSITTTIRIAELILKINDEEYRDGQEYDYIKGTDITISYEIDGIVATVKNNYLLTPSNTIDVNTPAGTYDVDFTLTQFGFVLETITITVNVVGFELDVDGLLIYEDTTVYYYAGETPNITYDVIPFGNTVAQDKGYTGELTTDFVESTSGIYTNTYTLKLDSATVQTVTLTIEVVDLHITVDSEDVTEDTTFYYYIGEDRPSITYLVYSNQTYQTRKFTALGYSVDITGNTTLDMNVAGTYNITYTVKHDETIIDTVVITIVVTELVVTIDNVDYTDQDTVNIEYGTTPVLSYVVNPSSDYDSDGYTITTDNTITNTTSVGTYYITYTLSINGEKITDITLTINVYDLVLTINGSVYTENSTIYYYLNDSHTLTTNVNPFTDLPTDYAITESGNNLNTEVAGTYVVTYSFTHNGEVLDSITITYYVSQLVVNIDGNEFTTDTSWAYYLNHTGQSITASVYPAEAASNYTITSTGTLITTSTGSTALTYSIDGITTIEITVYIVELIVSVDDVKYDNNDELDMYVSDNPNFSYELKPFTDNQQLIDAGLSVSPSSSFDSTTSGSYSVDFTISVGDLSFDAVTLNIKVVEMYIDIDSVRHTEDTTVIVYVGNTLSLTPGYTTSYDTYDVSTVDTYDLNTEGTYEVTYEIAGFVTEQKSITITIEVISLSISINGEDYDSESGYLEVYYKEEIDIEYTIAPYADTSEYKAAGFEISLSEQIDYTGAGEYDLNVIISKDNTEFTHDIVIQIRVLQAIITVDGDLYDNALSLYDDSTVITYINYPLTFSNGFNLTPNDNYTIEEVTTTINNSAGGTYTKEYKVLLDGEQVDYITITIEVLELVLKIDDTVYTDGNTYNIYLEHELDATYTLTPTNENLTVTWSTNFDNTVAGSYEVEFYLGTNSRAITKLKVLTLTINVLELEVNYDGETYTNGDTIDVFKGDVNDFTYSITPLEKTDGYTITPSTDIDNSTLAGSYTVTYDLLDGSTVLGTITLTINVIELTITIDGTEYTEDTTLVYYLGDTYSISSSLKPFGTNPVDYTLEDNLSSIDYSTTVPGTYLYTFSYTDGTNTINTIDITIKTIAIQVTDNITSDNVYLDNSNLYYELGTTLNLSYTLLAYNLSVGSDGTIETNSNDELNNLSIAIDNTNINTSLSGVYQLVISISDDNTQIGTTTVNVIVLDPYLVINSQDYRDTDTHSMFVSQSLNEELFVSPYSNDYANNAIIATPICNVDSSVDNNSTCTYIITVEGSNLSIELTINVQIRYNSIELIEGVDEITEGDIWENAGFIFVDQDTEGLYLVTPDIPSSLEADIILSGEHVITYTVTYNNIVVQTISRTVYVSEYVPYFNIRVIETTGTQFSFYIEYDDPKGFIIDASTRLVVGTSASNIIYNEHITLVSTGQTYTAYFNGVVDLDATYTIGLIVPLETGKNVPSLTFTAKYSEIGDFGDGTADNPYKIGSVEDFEYFRTYAYSHFVLTGDIDFSEASDYVPIRYFYGTIDGAGFSVLNLTPNEDYIRTAATNGTFTLFEDLVNATVKDFSVEMDLTSLNFANLKSNSRVIISGISTFVKNTSFENVHVTFKGTNTTTTNSIPLQLAGFSYRFLTGTTCDNCSVTYQDLSITQNTQFFAFVRNVEATNITIKNSSISGNATITTNYSPAWYAVDTTGRYNSTTNITNSSITLILSHMY